MKRGLFTLILVLAWYSNLAQQNIDSLRQALAMAKHDTTRVLVLEDLCSVYRRFKPDSSLLFGEKALELAQKINFSKGEMFSLNSLAESYRMQGNLPKALEFRYKSLEIAESKLPMLVESKAIILSGIGDTYLEINDYKKAIEYFRKSLLLDRKPFGANLLKLGIAFRKSGQLDSAWYYVDKLYNSADLKAYRKFPVSVVKEMGIIQFQMGNHRIAFDYLYQSVANLDRKNRSQSAEVYTTLSEFFKVTNQRDSSVYYAEKGLADAQSIGYQQGILMASNLLAEVYESKSIGKALYFQKIARAANEELYGVAKVQALQQTIVGEQVRQREMEVQRIARQNQIERYLLFAGLGVVLLIGFILYRSNRNQQKANRLLHHQKEEISHQRGQLEQANTGLEQTLSDLRTTQNQLIQKEKMASLGELTAGIAHEIQNPLNFVNNFSEVSVELIDEQQQALAQGDYEEVGAIAGDLRENLQRITQNGQRASNIVRGMLEHSRSSTGERQSADLNALAGEYLNLAYHGIRAKNPTFSCELKTDFDPNLPQLEVVPQDMGRVLLNLFNNAFYAVGQKQKTTPVDYQPTVWISTEQENGQVVMKVRDNGTGIPEAIREKIFQPFFTTKPTGEGTGLGLSLSYDIVTKGHGGMLAVSSVEGEGTEFVVTLPLQT